MKAHVAGPILSTPAQAAGVTLAGLPPTPHPACQRHIFTAGQYPTTPQTVEQITCLDTLCDTREVVLCPLTD
ncbi:hypothetical protein [Nioella nitratireducens]|uniref:hypothetical protein n=1 Tax=Nioella nitratireducens TaxID=1287720 RepID=UPI0011BAC552|nr:hypothetical protein [Nioella nitratireducens]